MEHVQAMVLRLVPTLKKAMCHTCMYMGHSTNIRNCIGLQPVLFLSANWTLFRTLTSVSVIVIILQIHFTTFNIHCLYIFAHNRSSAYSPSITCLDGYAPTELH